jgi:hypothetical protein
MAWRIPVGYRKGHWSPDRGCWNALGNGQPDLPVRVMEGISGLVPDDEAIIETGCDHI